MYSEKLNYKPYILIILLFMLDIIFFNFFEKQLINSLLCWYCIQTTKPILITHLFMSALFLCLESSLYYGRFGLQLAYLIPLAGLGYSLQKTFYKKNVYPYIMLIFSLFCQRAIEQYILELTSSWHYTIYRIFVNIGVLWIISLTYKD